MKSFLAGAVFRILAFLPLPLLHALGVFFGTLVWLFSPVSRRRTAENLTQAGIIANPYKVWRTACESVKSGLELAVAWTRSPQYIVSLFREVRGVEHLQAAVAGGSGILLITPHLGSYDLAGRVLSERLPFPLTAMYRPPKKTWLEPLMNRGRARGKGRTAPANAQGVRQVVRALRNREAVIVLPDQVPQTGEGVLVQFFGKTAYTMTLAGRLAAMKNVVPFLFVGQRLTWGRGFVLHIVPFSGCLNDSAAHNAQLVNHNIEALIRRFPEQYLFSYNRYKIPAGAGK